MKRAVLVVAPLFITLSSCGPSTEEIAETAVAVTDEAAQTATELYAKQIDIAATMVAGTAEFKRTLELAVEQTMTAQPTNTHTATATITSSPTYTNTWTPTPTVTPSSTPTSTPTVTSTNTPTSTITASPTHTASPVPTSTPIPLPTSMPTSTPNPSGRNELPAGTITNIHVNGHGPTFIEIEYDYEWTSLIPDWWLLRGAQGNLHGDIVLFYKNLVTGTKGSYFDYLTLSEMRSSTLTKPYGTDKICIWKDSGQYEMTHIRVILNTNYSEIGTPIPGYPWLNTLQNNYWVTTETVPYTGWQFTCP